MPASIFAEAHSGYMKIKDAVSNSKPCSDRSSIVPPYWSRERYGFGLKSILNLYHVTIGRPSRHVCVIASKQIRSSHYYDGSLGLMVLFDAEPPAGDQQSSYLVYVNRSRVDLLRGSGLWSWKRLLFERYLSGEIRKQLTLIKNAVDK